MRMFSKILVPIDFTSCSAAAVQRAVGLAAESDAKLVLAHVWSPSSYTTAGYIDFTPDQLARMSQDAERRLDAARRDVEALGGRPVATRLVYGKPAEAIIALAEQEHFDLIVVGTHGRTGIDRWITGSVAEAVSRAAPCSVLTAKPAGAGAAGATPGGRRCAGRATLPSRRGRASARVNAQRRALGERNRRRRRHVPLAELD